MIGTRLLHYEILDRLGEGGMGEVYRAHDHRLDRDVALKVLPATVANDPDRRQRLEREARAVARLAHPGVVTVYAIEEADDVLFLTMELVDGETLRDLLQREPPAPSKMLSLATSIAEGLAAAHRAGITHQDLKPENVMVMPAGETKILDFGLARLVGPRRGDPHGDDQPHEAGVPTESVALDGPIGGTVAYMSPEQANGQVADARSDVFSFGVMLYEMLSGRRPFTGDSTASILASILRDDPPPVITLRGDVPAAIDAVLERCLAKRPGERYDSGVGIEAALRAISPRMPVPSTQSAATRSPATGSPATRSPGTTLAVRLAFLALASVLILASVTLIDRTLGLPSWILPGAGILLAVGLVSLLFTWRSETTGGGILTWRRWALGGVLAFALLTILAAGYLWMRTSGIGPAATLVSAGVLDSEARVLVADIDDRASDPLLADAVREALSVDLGQSPVVSVVSPARVHYLLARMELPPDTPLDEETARELALRDGIPAVLSGTVSGVGSGYVLSVRLWNPESRNDLLAVRETASSPDEIIPALERLSHNLRERTGESFRSLRSRGGLEEVTTRSLPALRAYTRALQLADENEEGRAIALLEDAIAADSTFAMAHRKMGVLLNNHEEAGRAITAAYRLRHRLTERERLLAEAAYHSHFDRVEEAVAAYEQLLALDSDDQWALNNLGVMYGRRGDHDRAVEYMYPAMAAAPSPFQIDNLVWQLTAAGRVTEADSVAAHYASTLDLPPSADVQAAVAATRRDYRRAESLLRSLDDSNGGNGIESDMYWTLVAVLCTRGKIAEADQLATRMFEYYKEQGDADACHNIVLDMTTVEAIVLGDEKAARERLDSLLEEVPLESVPPGSREYGIFMGLEALLGNLDRARAMQSEQAALPDSLQDLTSSESGQGWIDFAEGNLSVAVERFREIDRRESDAQVWPSAWIGFAFDAMAQPDSAIAAYERYVESTLMNRMWVDRFFLGPVLLRLARLYSERGDAAAAERALDEVSVLWEEADPKLQHVVDARRRGIHVALEPGGTLLRGVD